MEYLKKLTFPHILVLIIFTVLFSRESLQSTGHSSCEQFEQGRIQRPSFCSLSKESDRVRTSGEIITLFVL